MTHTIHKIKVEMDCHQADSFTGKDLGKCTKDCLECLQDVMQDIIFMAVTKAERIA